MSSIRFTSFGAATVPLSKIIPDGDFDIRPYGITAAFARFPYRPIDWETEELEWGDGEPSSPVVVVTKAMIMPGSPISTTVFTAVELTEIAVTITNAGSGDPSDLQCFVRIDGVDVVECPVLELEGESHTVTLVVGAGETVSVHTAAVTPGVAGQVTISYVLTGRFVGEKIFDLSGKWLALGIDMHNVPATVVIQGVEMPYNDYAKYFPIAPSALKFPADWENGRVRPIVEVYK